MVSLTNHVSSIMILSLRSLFSGILLSLLLVLPAFGEIGGSRYYIFARADMRLCPSPLCGGVFVREVNRLFTRCGDGKFRRDCYVAGIDTSSLGLSENRAFSFLTLFGQGLGILKGSFSPLASPFEGLFELTAEEAWEAQSRSHEKGFSYLFMDNGIRCFVAPCPSIDEAKLNSPMKRRISGLDLTRTGAAEEAVADGYESLVTHGVIASGLHSIIQGPPGASLKFTALRFYLKAEEGPLCGGIAGILCPEGKFCDITIPNACSGADLPGVCRVVPQACIQIFDPVCGCDGATYGNDCERLAAGVQLDHRGQCGIAVK